MSFKFDGLERKGPMEQLNLRRLEATMKEGSDGQVTYELIHNIHANVVDMFDQVIVDAIVKEAYEMGVTDLFLIDKEFIRTAIKNELDRRKAEGGET